MISTTQSKWRQSIKKKTRANDLDALRLYFAIRATDKWNSDLAKEQGS